MLPADQTVQCYDCGRYFWGDDNEAFERDHPAPWLLVNEDGNEES